MLTSNTIVNLQLELIKMIGEGKFINENSTSPRFRVELRLEF